LARTRVQTPGRPGRGKEEEEEEEEERRLAETAGQGLEETLSELDRIFAGPRFGGEPEEEEEPRSSGMSTPLSSPRR